MQLHSSPEKTNAPCNHPVAQRLAALIQEKQTRLIVAADVTTKKELLELAQQVGPYICALKTHIDIVTDFDTDLIVQLKSLAHEHNFLLIEDRKFCDIGSTVRAQVADGIYHITQWADIVIAHAVAGPGTIEGIKQASDGNCAMLLVVQLSCAGNLIDLDYTKRAIEMGMAHRDTVIGFVAQEKCWDDEAMFCFTPGVNLSQKGDNLGQQYNTPQYVVEKKGTDCIIVGRGIYKSKDPAQAAKLYRDSSIGIKNLVLL